MKQHPGSGTLILEKAAVSAADFLRQHRIPFFSSLIFGLLAYGYAFTNKLVNHDEVSALFTKGATVTSGRWGLGALDTVFPNYSMPWIYGLITIFLMALSVCLVIRICRLENSLLQVLLSGCIVVFPSLIGLFGYMFTSSSFALAFFLAVFSVWLVQIQNKWLYLPALGSLIFSLSIYQSYISIAASILVLILIQRTLTNENPGKIFRDGIFYVLFLICALGLYYLSTHIVLRITGNQMNAYASENLAFSISSVLNGAGLAYCNFLRFFTEGFRGLVPTAFSRILHGILLFSTAGLLLPLFIRTARKGPGGLLLLSALVAVLPLSINCMYMITTADSVHTLVLYGFVAVYILVAILADHILSGAESSFVSGILLNLATAAMALILTVNTYVANQSYLHLHLRYENASAFYTALIADIKMTPGFDENTKLAVMGEYQQPDYYHQKFEQLHEITGIYGFVPDSYSKNYFLEYYTGFPVPMASEKEMNAIAATPEFEQMPVYPYGSMRMMENILVVKLS